MYDEQGNKVSKPTWQAEDQPAKIISSISEVFVIIPKEVKRIKIALKRGSGMSIVLTEASSRKLRAVMEKAGKDAWYEFEDREAVIYVPEKEQPLEEFLKTI